MLLLIKHGDPVDDDRVRAAIPVAIEQHERGVYPMDA